MSITVQTALVGLLVAMPSPIGVAKDLVDAADPDELVALIRDLGYRAELEIDAAGDPLIRSSVGGTKFAIIFYGCDEHRHDGCDFLLYKVGYDLDDGVDLDVVNAWNASQLVGRAYRDEVDDPWLEMAWNLTGGVSRRNFESTFGWWERTVAQFENHIGF
jgi:hypothetical protein